jgi:hypothetical protein
MSQTRSRGTPDRQAGEPARVRMDGTTASPDANKPGGRTGASNSSYERYKQQLHAFFNGDKPLPEHLKDMLSTRPGAGQHGFGDEVVDDGAPKPDLDTLEAAPKPQKKEEPRRRVVAATAEDIVLAEAIKKASSPKEAQIAVDALLARGFPLPKDADILGKALGHSDDGVLEKALAGLVALLDEGSFKGNGTLLKTRAKNVALLSSSSTVRGLCTELMSKL